LRNALNLNPETIMRKFNKKLSWSLPVAVAAVAPFALVPQRAMCAISEAIDWVGNDRVGSLLAVTNALTLVP
jgi:hypothetical protein